MILVENAKAPDEKIAALCSVHHEFRTTWELQRKFPSASEYELSLFAMAAHSELIWTDQELVDLGIEFRRRHGFAQKWKKSGNAIKYYQETIGKARKDNEFPAIPTLVQPEELHNTELGNARRLVQLHGNNLRYCIPANKSTLDNESSRRCSRGPATVTLVLFGPQPGQQK